MDLDLVSWSELLISRNNLQCHSSVVVVEINDQIMCDTDRKAEVSPSNPDYELTHQAPTVGATIRHDNEHTIERASCS